jgi:hypothetical protein
MVLWGNQDNQQSSIFPTSLPLCDERFLKVGCYDECPVKKLSTGIKLTKSTFSFGG